MGKDITGTRVGAPDFAYEGREMMVRLRSDKDLHFTGAIAQNGEEQENIAGLISNRIIIRGVTINSRQALKYRLSFYKKDTFSQSDVDDDTFVGSVILDLPTFSSEITVG